MWHEPKHLEVWQDRLHARDRLYREHDGATRKNVMMGDIDVVRAAAWIVGSCRVTWRGCDAGLQGLRADQFRPTCHVDDDDAAAFTPSYAAFPVERSLKL